MTATVSPVGTGGKVVTAFVAGVTLGVLAMVQIVPNSLAGSGNGGGLVVLGDGGGLSEEDVEQLEELGIDPGDLGDGSGLEGEALAGPGGSSSADGASRATGDTGAAGGGGTAGTGGTAGGVSGGAGGTTGGDTSGGNDRGSGCAANNGGATDKGVTATEIKVAATTVEDGPGESLLKPASIGMRAIVDKVNAAGGICGRRIMLTTRNDGWQAARGRGYIRTFIEQDHFALLVVPSSEGLAEAIRNKDISNAGIPVVGTTGLRIDEYRDPWVFPVGTATVSIMRVMAKHAYDDGARTFGIVWDDKYRFGREGRDAFRAYVDSLPGASMKADVALNPDNTSYGTEARSFNTQCGNDRNTRGCDMVALLLVPEVALKWTSFNQGTNEGVGVRTYGAQTLFTDQYAGACNDWCDGMLVWTGYNPYVGPIQDLPGMKQYRTDVGRVTTGADLRNQFLQGAYLGSQVFVEAVERCSPEVTRRCIRDTLNQMDFKTDLSSTLAWRPDQRHANRAAQAFRLTARAGNFNGWQDARTGFIPDPGL